MIGDPNKSDTKGYISNKGNFQTFTFSLCDLRKQVKTFYPGFNSYFRISFDSFLFQFCDDFF